MNFHFLITIFLFIITSRSNALNCTDADQPIEILNDFTLLAVKEALNNLTVTDRYDQCLVEIYMDYLGQYIKITFGTALQSHHLMRNQEVRIEFLIRLTEDEPDFNSAITNILEFACDYTDECDRYFVLNHLEWLFKAKYIELDSAIRPSLTANDDNNTGKNTMFNYIHI
jgi:hypothetical protein